MQFSEPHIYDHNLTLLCIILYIYIILYNNLLYIHYIYILGLYFINPPVLHIYKCLIPMNTQGLMFGRKKNIRKMCLLLISEFLALTIVLNYDLEFVTVVLIVNTSHYQ